MEKQIGPYDIVRLIGAGGTGAVYEAIHKQIQRRAAIKVLHKDFQQDAEFVQRFFNEARAVNIINHPNLVSIYDFGTAENGTPYIVMEYLEGDSLRQRLARSGRLAPEAVMRIGKQIAAGLAAAHAKRVVHRDLKPVNIMLVPEADGTDGERAKILDFGIAKINPEAGSNALTRMGVSMGTPAYMSPEQCKSARDVSDRADVYALGVVLFEMLSGEHPFAEATADSAMMASHIGKEPPPLDSKAQGVPHELSVQIHRMLSKQPDARPSAAEVVATLGRMSGSTTGLHGLVPGPPDSLSAQLALPAPMTAAAQAGAGSGLLGSLQLRLGDSGSVLIAAGAALLIGLIGIVLVARALLNMGPAAKEEARWSIRSEPSDSEIFDGTGQLLGKTPFLHTCPRGSRIEIVSLRKEGYAEQQLPLDCGHDGNHSVTLIALPKQPAAVAAPSATLPSDSESAKGKHAKKRKGGRKKEAQR